MSKETLKASIRDHYDRASPLYRDLWGIHLHHGYWVDGTETKELAQEQLIELLVRRAAIPKDSRVLDIGCGIGGTAIYLAERLGMRVTGITISPMQAAMAAQMAAARRLSVCSFAAMDAEEIAIRDEFDVVWSVEALSHMAERQRVFEDAIALLKPRGKLAIIDWFRPPDLSPDDIRKHLSPLEESMLVPALDTMTGYIGHIQSLNCRILSQEDLTSSVVRTWDICMEFARLPSVWRFALAQGPDFLRFLRGFQLMRNAFRTGVFRYGLITAEKL